MMQSFETTIQIPSRIQSLILSKSEEKGVSQSETIVELIDGHVAKRLQFIPGHVVIDRLLYEADRCGQHQIWIEKLKAMVSSAFPALFHLRDTGIISMSKAEISLYLRLRSLFELSRDDSIPEQIRTDLNKYFTTFVPDMNFKQAAQSDIANNHHGYSVLIVYGFMKKIFYQFYEYKEVPVISKKNSDWDEIKIILPDDLTKKLDKISEDVIIDGGKMPINSLVFNILMSESLKLH